MNVTKNSQIYGVRLLAVTRNSMCKGAVSAPIPDQSRSLIHTLTGADLSRRPQEQLIRETGAVRKTLLRLIRRQRGKLRAGKADYDFSRHLALFQALALLDKWDRKAGVERAIRPRQIT
jgi:hypothetical protein